MSRHDLAEARSLAYHTEVARRLREDDAFVRKALVRVQGWRGAGKIHPEYAAAWCQLLEGPLSELCELLTSNSSFARALRQTTPFAGAMTARERWQIWSSVSQARGSP